MKAISAVETQRKALTLVLEPVVDEANRPVTAAGAAARQHLRGRLLLLLGLQHPVRVAQLVLAAGVRPLAAAFNRRARPANAALERQTPPAVSRP